MGGDALAIRYGNKLQKYLWNAWKDSLKRKDFTWQKFIKLLKYKTEDILLWIENDIDWDRCMKKIIKSIEGTLGKNIGKV